MHKSALAVVVVVALAGISLYAQGGSTTISGETERKVSQRVTPNYPELAKKMHIHGMVKVEATVRPNGSVKSTRILGGNPVLIEAAQDAVTKWKFEPTQSETTEIVQLSFEKQ